MDNRRTKVDPESERKLRGDFYAAVENGELSVGQAVATMRRISKLTQPEFAKHRGISLASLKLIERDQGNPTVQHLNKIAAIFGLQVGFVRTPPKQ